MLSFEELAVMLSLDTDIGMTKTAVSLNSIFLCPSERFDKRVALATIDRLCGFGFVTRDDSSGFYFATQKGFNEVVKTKQNVKIMLSKLSGNNNDRT